MNTRLTITAAACGLLAWCARQLWLRRKARRIAQRWAQRRQRERFRRGH